MYLLFSFTKPIHFYSDKTIRVRHKTPSTQNNTAIYLVSYHLHHIFSPHQDYPTYTVSQAVMRHHLFTIILDTPDHYWPITHIALTYSDIYDDISNVYILFCLILFAPHLCHDPATPLHYDDIIIAIDTALSALLLVHIIGITVPHYSRHRVPLV